MGVRIRGMVLEHREMAPLIDLDIFSFLFLCYNSSFYVILLILIICFVHIAIFMRAYFVNIVFLWTSIVYDVCNVNDYSQLSWEILEPNWTNGEQRKRKCEINVEKQLRLGSHYNVAKNYVGLFDAVYSVQMWWTYNPHTTRFMY